MSSHQGTRRARLAGTVTLGLWVLAGAMGSVSAQVPFDSEPINYSSCTPDDAVARLQKRIDDGSLRLEFEEGHGFLKSVLTALEIPVASQMLVFSQTSFQHRLIHPWSPRALYFNDDTYVGWVQRGDVIEVSSVDPKQGPMFYTLRQQKTEHPKFVRDGGNCMSCHAASRTRGIPGYVVRSVYPSPTGQPHYGAGTFRTDQTSPLHERWGGWYVTGTHGSQRHMGNVVATDEGNPELDVESGANVTDLTDRFRTAPYLSRHSDIVALMVLEHQADMHNFITSAGYNARIAVHQGATMNRVFEEPPDHVSDSTKRRIASASDKLLNYLLFSGEAALTDRIEGTSSFAEGFAARGRTDERGRSLRDFDLERRIFKYPCSYLIHSSAFRSLPDLVKEHVYRRLWEILTGRDKSDDFAHLSSADRQAIHEILRDTHDGIPDYWTSDER